MRIVVRVIEPEIMAGYQPACIRAMNLGFAEHAMQILLGNHSRPTPQMSTQVFLVMFATNHRQLGQVLLGILIWCPLMCLLAEAVIVVNLMMEKMVRVLRWIVRGVVVTGLEEVKGDCFLNGIDFIFQLASISVRVLVFKISNEMYEK